jgi:hypothetical protein
MNDDPLETAKQVLGVLGTVRPQLEAFDRVKGDELIARAREPIMPRPLPREVAPLRTMIASRPEKVRLQKTRREKTGRWVCVICGVPGCMIAPRWVSDE